MHENCDDSYRMFVYGNSLEIDHFQKDNYEKDNYKEALNEMKHSSTILMLISNIITVYLIEQKPRYKYGLITLNSLATIYLVNLSRLEALQFDNPF